MFSARPTLSGTAMARYTIRDADREQFVEVAETELLGLHEGNFARYQIRPSKFAVWREVWNPN